MNKKAAGNPIKFSVAIVVEPDDGRFHAFCPALKGLHVDGETEKDAIENAKVAVVLYLKSLIQHGDPIPLTVISEDEPDSHGTKHIEQIPVLLPC